MFIVDKELASHLQHKADLKLKRGKKVEKRKKAKAKKNRGEHAENVQKPENENS